MDNQLEKLQDQVKMLEDKIDKLAEHEKGTVEQMKNIYIVTILILLPLFFSAFISGGSIILTIISLLLFIDVCITLKKKK